MFKWANKESLEKRGSNKKAKSLQTQKSYPSSPAHSNATLGSRIMSNNENRKKVILKTNKKEKKGLACNLFGETEWQKSNKGDLLKLIQNKKTNIHVQKQMDRQNARDSPTQTFRKKMCFSPHKNETHHENLYKYCNHPTKTKKSTIKIVIPHNQLLPEFLNVYYEVKTKIWNIYTLAFILWEMGFIKDMVFDRQSVKKVWGQLYCPDVLIVYTFVERIMNNKVNIEEASRILEVKNTQFASLWMKTAHFSQDLSKIMVQMRNNRNSRKKNYQGE